MAETLRVGFIGLGTMGMPMARNLARAGFPLALSNRTLERARALANELSGEHPNVRVFERPEQVGSESDVVVSCLPDSPEVEEVHLGPAGTARGRGPRCDRHRLLDDGGRGGAADRRRSSRSSASPSSTRRSPADRRERSKARSRSSSEATRPRSSGARPVFEAMGRRVTHLGPSGAGQLGKAANQILVACNLLAVSEAMAFAQRVGLPLDALHAALTAGAANSWALEVLGRKMIDRDFKPAFAVKHQQKDLAILLATARANGVPLPGAALVHQLLAALEGQGRGDDGTQALLTLYEQMGKPTGA